MFFVNNTNIKKLILHFLFISLFFNYACTKKQNTKVYIFYDISEGLSEEVKSEYKNDINQILKKMDIRHARGKIGSGYGELCFSFLNHEYFDKPFYFNLDKRGINESRILYMKKIENFVNNVKNSLSDCLDRPITKLDISSSIIFRHIFEGLEELKNSLCEKKIMVIYSDMIEHNPKEGVSFITGNLNENNFDITVNKIENTYQIKIPKPTEFEGLPIYIIRPDHEKYRQQRLIVEKLWKKILANSCQFQPKLRFTN